MMVFFASLLGIREISVRIRIRGAVPVTNGSGSHIIFSLLSTALKKSFVLNFILQVLFQSAQHIYEKREGSGSGAVPLTNGSGRHKNIRIRIPNTALLIPWSTHTQNPASPPVRYSSIILKPLSFSTSLFLCECVGVRGQQREERGGGGDGEGGHPRPRRPAGQ